jgi:hypothetical protein
MRLESKLVDVFKPYILKSIDEVSLNEILLNLRRLFFPVRLFQR